MHLLPKLDFVGMSSQLLGKLAIVTGSASGIGKAVCQRFSKEGAACVMIDMNKNKVEEVKNSLVDCDKHFVIEGDVSDSGFVKSVFTQVKEKYGVKGDILVNSAGITRDNFLLKIKEEDFDKVIDVNLKGIHLMTQNFVASLANNKGFDPAAVVNIASIIGKSGNVGQSNYAASKAGVIAFTKSVGYEFGRFGIRCNSVLPGFTTTPMTDVVPQPIMEKVRKQIPMKRFASPDEIANVCLFLSSNESSYVNCAALEVTGGLLA